MTNIEALTPMMQQYVAVKKQHPDCLLFYRLGDFFELFFEDAVTASRELDIALTKRGRQSGQDIPMCGVPAHSYELYLAKLIQKGYKVVICDQVETPEEAKKRGAKGPLTRDITRIVTSGTLTEEGLLPTGNNYIVALSNALKGQNTMALAVADISTGFFGVEETSVQEIGNTLERWNPSEIIISDELYENTFLKSSFDFWHKRLTILPKGRFHKDNVEYFLKSTYNVQTLSVFGLTNIPEIQAAGVLVDYIMTTQCCRTLSLSAPKIIQSRDFLSIDAATRRNLELMVSLSEQKNSTLFAAINRTLTAVGRRLLAKWISAPLLNINIINTRLDDIELFIKNSHFRDKIRKLLQNLPDIERILSRIILKRMSPRDFGSLRLALEKAENIQEEIRPYNTLLEKFSLSAFPFSLKEELVRAFKEELPSFVRDGGFIADGFDAPLDEVRDLRDHISEKLKNLQEQYIQQTGIYNLKIRRNNIWGIYIEVSTAQTAKVPFDFIHKQTLTNCKRYTTSALIELEEKVDKAESEALKRELEILDEFIQKVLNVRQELLFISEFIAYLDVVSAGAELALANKYVRPCFSDKSELEIVEGRHPIVEQMFQNKEVSFTSNDCVLDYETRRFLLVTGPNMAGKSTYLRQNALIIIMAQMGYFVPASQVKIGIVDKIFSRIGASDDLASGRSTFMMEMIETATILHQATEKSFVILDEIGRGTATYDGLAIAWAVSEHLYQNIQCRTLFATHYHELTKLSEKLKAIVPVTASTREWNDKIIFLHKIIDGCAQKSYGIHVAQLAGIPKTVIHRATELLKAFESDGNVLSKRERTVKKAMQTHQKELF